MSLYSNSSRSSLSFSQGRYAPACLPPYAPDGLPLYTPGNIPPYGLGGLSPYTPPSLPPDIPWGGPPGDPERDPWPRRIGEEEYEPRQWTSHRKLQWVWPKDNHQSCGGRLKDVISRKGPDIFIGRRNDPGPHRSIWSGWNQHGLTSNINQYGQVTLPAFWSERNHLGERFNAMPLLRSADRRDTEGQVYDFHRRRYGRKERAVWSDARRSRQKPRELLFTRDRNGRATYQGGFPDERPLPAGRPHYGEGAWTRGYGGGIGDNYGIRDAMLHNSGIGNDSDLWHQRGWEGDGAWSPEDSSLDDYHGNW